MSIESLENENTGRFVVTTFSGTRHFVDLDAKAVIRRGAEGREWGRQVVMVDPFVALGGSRPKAAAYVFDTAAPDGVPFFYDSIQDVTVGKRMRLDNLTEWRITSTIQSIEPWDEAGEDDSIQS